MNKWIQSARHALEGIVAFVRTERNGSIQFSLFILVCVLGFWFNIDKYEWVAILICSALVFCLEMVNTAVEKLLDHLHPERNEKVQFIKDVLAGSVLISSLAAAVVGVMIFREYLGF